MLLTFILVAFPNESFTQRIANSIIDDPIAPSWKSKSKLEEDLRGSPIFRGRQFSTKDHLKLSRKAISAEYVLAACSGGLMYALQLILYLINSQMKDLSLDSDFVGYLAHNLLLLAIRHGFTECSEPLIEDIYNGMYPDWHPQRTAFEFVNGFFTFTMSLYEHAAVEWGDEEMAGRLFDLTQKCLLNDQILQRPSRERVIELALERRNSSQLDGQRSQRYVVDEDCQQAIHLVYSRLVEIPQSDMPSGDGAAQAPKSDTSQESESMSARFPNTRWR